MKKGYTKFISPIYVLNIIFQSFISLISPIAVMFFAAWLLVKYASLGPWIYAVLILIGTLSGFYSMISFILRSTRALEMLDKQNSAKKEDKPHRNE